MGYQMTATLQMVPRSGANGYRLSEDLIAALRARIDSRFYDRPEVIEVLARAILCSRGVYL